MSFDEVFDLTAVVLFDFYNILLIDYTSGACFLQDYTYAPAYGNKQPPNGVPEQYDRLYWGNLGLKMSEKMLRR